MSMNQITAVIPTLSNKTGLSHLLTELKVANVETIVIDNSKKNVGFAPAVNKGVKQAETEWVLIANDDIENITREKLSHMLATADKNNWVAVSPILKSPKGTVENIGYRILPIGKAELNFEVTKNSYVDLDGLTMASLLIKKDVYEQLCGLDESFVAYLEDVDFFLRLKKKGYHFGVDIDVEVLHNHMTTSKKMKGFKEKRDMINWWKVIFKNWNKSTWKEYWLEILLERSRNAFGYIKSICC